MQAPGKHAAVAGHPGRLVENLAGFARTLRRAGLQVDAARVGLACEALVLVGLARRDDVEAALQAVLVNRAQDRAVFRELFAAYFREPDLAGRLVPGMPPANEAEDRPGKPLSRAQDALSPQGAHPPAVLPRPEEPGTRNAALSASDLARLRQADFNALSASEFRSVQGLARDIRLPLPQYVTRRTRQGARGAQIHWPFALRKAARTGGELLQLPRRERCRQPLPLLVLLDVSGSMERYARMLLAFLHAATRSLRRRDVFAFGTQLTDLGEAMRESDVDRMLALAGRAIADFAGGTRLGDSLATLRQQHARRLVGRRTLVLLISDGLDTGSPQALARELDWLRRHSGRLLWLNPLLRFDGYAPLAQGAAVLHARAHGMLAVHKLEKLELLAASIAALLRR